MDLSQFNFPFDHALVAKYPVHPRDHARLLVLTRSTGDIIDRQVKDLPNILRPGDLLVVNNTKVIPARLWAKKVPSGGRVELLFVKEIGEDHAEVLIQGKVGVGQIVECEGSARAQVVEKEPGRTVIHWLGPGALRTWLLSHGEIPLPPYLKRQPVARDQEDYQTVFAKVDGAIAAPTAGLHFTPQLITQLEEKGIGTVTVTLHVGPGTFQPVKTTDITRHIMHPEWFEVSEETAKRIREVRKQGGRIVAVGTTVARSLESALDDTGELRPRSGETRLFILPGFKFRVLDGLLTNFHFPETTLLMLVAAFAGLEEVRNAYVHAVCERYRFYSYGDAMLILE
ncbi:MAG: tRNA preQ1(34) S-adenosylmethionine ribosyltransferase-isomerase QueA [Nitrospiraceae bacterium]|nr:tRNA preQ1(34) S-adenosylmethionine ribosyltransferase-isomerase QueA [Nitrospira sp.]MCB9773019.1 tRNA preQ1(34) S-adenosylmethionine ribosyltransferase-isomerase QueA [Nitrospiraceae bacterium]